MDKRSFLSRILAKVKLSVAPGGTYLPYLKLAALLVLTICVAIGAWYRPASYSRPDIVLGIVVLVMAVLGGIVSLHSPGWIGWKLLYGAAFLVLAVLGMRLVIQQSNDAAATNDKLSRQQQEFTHKQNELIQQVNSLKATMRLR